MNAYEFLLTKLDLLILERIKESDEDDDEDSYV